MSSGTGRSPTTTGSAPSHRGRLHATEEGATPTQAGAWVRLLFVASRAGSALGSDQHLRMLVAEQIKDPTGETLITRFTRAAGGDHTLALCAVAAEMTLAETRTAVTEHPRGVRTLAALRGFTLAAA